MPNALTPDPKRFVATVTLSPADLGLYAAVRQAKGVTNDEALSAMASFCLQLLASELIGLGPEGSLGDDLDRTVMKVANELKQLRHLLSGAEKVLLDTAALREHLARRIARAP